MDRMRALAVLASCLLWKAAKKKKKKGCASKKRDEYDCFAFTYVLNKNRGDSATRGRVWY